MPKHHDRRLDVAQWAKEPRPEWGRRMARFGASGMLTGALAPLPGLRSRSGCFGGVGSRPFLPQRAIRRSQFSAIDESMA